MLIFQGVPSRNPPGEKEHHLQRCLVLGDKKVTLKKHEKTLWMALLFLISWMVGVDGRNPAPVVDGSGSHYLQDP